MKHLKHQSGNVIFPLLVVVAVVISSLLFYSNQTMLLRKLDSNRFGTVFSLKAYVGSVQAMLLSQKSLIKTLKTNLNGNLWRCVNDVEYVCSQVTPTDMNLITETGDDTNPFISSNPSSGLSATLAPCTGYPSLACPFRYRLQWYIECPSSAVSCQSPDVFIQGNLEIAAAVTSRLTLNPTHYSFLYKVK